MQRIPAYIKYIIKIYLSGLIFFTIFRILFFAAHIGYTDNIPVTTLIQAFIMGYRFDTVVSGYILMMPFIVLSAFYLLNKNQKFLKVVIKTWLFLCYGTSFLICAADIPYFTHFHSKFTVAALNWFNTPVFLLKLITSETIYLIYISLFCIALYVWYLIIKHIRFPEYEYLSGWKKFAWFLPAFILLFLGLRGRIEPKSPIRWGTAFFSEYAFANNLGLNPVFTFIKTTIDSGKKKNKEVQFTDENTAVESVRNFLKIELSAKGTILGREQLADSTEKKHNVVLVLMESMSADYMGVFGNGQNLTPVLDSLSKNSLFYNNFYSSGTHTFNGIYSTLYSMPAFLHRHPMKDFENFNQPQGIAIELRKHNYNTIYLCTHDEQFDNMGGFLVANGFQQIISEKDYPKAKVVSTLGIPDHVLFDEAIQRINNLAKDTNPFFATILTASNHPPLIIPQNISFSPHSAEKEFQLVEYADWSIGEFLKNAGLQEWFNNTIFIFLGDHGRAVNPVYDMPVSYHHIPFIIYAPSIFNQSRTISNFGGQIDVFPTVMSMLNISFLNMGTGVNLETEKREFIYFSTDDKLGCMNDSLFFIRRQNGVNSLYLYKNRDQKDYSEIYPDIAQIMKSYAENMTQVSFMVLKNHQKRKAIKD